MSGKIEISREHVERLADRLSKAQMFKEASELRALLAAPVVERQPAVLPCDVKVAPNTTTKKGFNFAALLGCIELRRGRPDEFTRFKRAEQPAPTAVVLPEYTH